MTRNIIVFGATGKTGIQICNELESKNLPYTVFVRKESSDKITNSDTIIKSGDVLNSKDVENAFIRESYTDVIIALGSKDFKNSMIRSTGTKNIVDAMTKTQSKASIHAISALGIGESWNQLTWFMKLISNVLIKNTMKDHTAQENCITNSSFTYHIIRPVELKDGYGTGEIHLQNEGFLPSGAIQRADVAKYLVQNLLANKTGFSGICQKK